MNWIPALNRSRYFSGEWRNVKSDRESFHDWANVYDLRFNTNEKGNIEMAIYTIRVDSIFVLTQAQVKQALGHGYKISSVELEKEFRPKPITDVDSAVENIIRTGYRALIRAYHPDLGGSEAVTRILNQANKELQELLESVK